MSRYKFNRSRYTVTLQDLYCGHWRSVAPKALTEAEGERHGVQSVSEAEISYGAGFLLRADARVRVQQPLQICLGSRGKSKNRDTGRGSPAVAGTGSGASHETFLFSLKIVATWSGNCIYRPVSGSCFYASNVSPYFPFVTFVIFSESFLKKLFFSNNDKVIDYHAIYSKK